MKVYVYYNLHKKLWSIKALEGPRKGRVVTHRDALWLRNATPKVSEAGRQRVIKEQCKNVHAGIVGEWEENTRTEAKRLYGVNYNPYYSGSFYIQTGGCPDYMGSEYVRFTGNKVEAYESSGV